jgi:hypothetical protein
MDQSMNASVAERGPWSTGVSVLVALTPLVVGLALGVAMDNRPGIGPFSSDQLTYWVILPLIAIYPTVAAIARRMAYAPTTVLMIAAIAPALVYATRLALQAMPADRASHTAVTFGVVLQRAWPAAVLAAGTFVAIEIATAAIRRGVAVGVFGAIIAGGVVLGSVYVGFLPLPIPTT